MKQVLAVASVVLSKPAISLKVPSSLLEESDAECFAHSCGKGYIPKFNHDKLKGSTDPECCQATCELFTCTGLYVRPSTRCHILLGEVKNDAYAGNVGASNQQCCDQTCAAVHCPLGMKVPTELRESAGKTVEECCRDTCKNVTCAPFYLPLGANQNEVYPDGEAQGFCCEPTCQAYTCDVAKGLTLDEAKGHLTRVSDSTCCAATCSSTSCPKGYKTHPAKVNMDARKTECCEPLCSSHVCSAGWVPDISKVASVGNTDEVCCQRTCDVFRCSEGFAKNPASSKHIGVDDVTCCLPQCIQYQPKCTGDYAPNPDMNKTVGQTADVCCKKACSLYPCATGRVNVPDAPSVVAETDDECCEDFRCPAYRKKNEVKDGCNQLSKDECEKSYIKLKNTHTNQTDTLSCKWAEYGLCQVNELEPVSCAD